MMNHADKKQKNSISKFIKSKLINIRKKRSPKNTDDSPDHFIKKYNQTSPNPTTDIKSLDLRRKIFVSLLHLYQSWQQCPSHILYSAIFILPLKQDWIYDPTKYMEELKTHMISKIGWFSDVSKMEQFVQLLKWKDSQGLIFWMLDIESDAYDNNINSLIHPFWYDVSQKLSNLYDPVTGYKYKGINFDTRWWQNKAKYVSKYDVKTASILSEFYFLTMKFKSMQEILYQSNPKSLHPIKSYKTDDCPPIPCYKLYEYDEVEEELILSKTSASQMSDDGDIWWVSEEYDPYDIDDLN
eukprot:UN00994